MVRDRSGRAALSSAHPARAPLMCQRPRSQDFRPVVQRSSSASYVTLCIRPRSRPVEKYPPSVRLGETAAGRLRLRITGWSVRGHGHGPIRLAGACDCPGCILQR
jgi:hypothetical protein